MGQISDVLHKGDTGRGGCIFCSKGIQAVMGSDSDRWCDDLMGDCHKKWRSLLFRNRLSGGEWLPVLHFGGRKKRVVLVAVEPTS